MSLPQRGIFQAPLEKNSSTLMHGFLQAGSTAVPNIGLPPLDLTSYIFLLF